MPIEVEGPDGTVIEFPDDTPTETMKSVMAKHYDVKSGRTGKSYTFDIHDGADDAAILAAAKAALQKQEPETVEQPVFADSGTPEPPTAMEAIGGAVKDFGTNLTNGFASLPDMVSQAAQPITNALSGAARFLTTGGGASSGTVGNPSSSDQMANALFGQQSAPTMRGLNEQLNPGAYERSNTGFATELLGASMLPIGPKAAPRPVSAPVSNALAPVAKGSSKLIPGAADVVAAGEREGVRVMRSDVAPPKTFIGRSARATGEKIPLTGTGEQRAAQQGERIEAVKNLLREYGADDAGEAVEGVAADFAKTRGQQVSNLTTAKNSVIASVKGGVPAQALDATLKAISGQITRLQGINADAYAPVIAKLKNFEEVLQSGKTLEQIEGNRKLLGDMFADPSLAAIKGDGQKAINAIYDPLRTDMGAFIEAAAGKEARLRWKGANDRLAAMAGELGDSAFKSALKKAETTPEDAAKLIFSKKPSDLRRLYRNLSPEGQTKAQAAILFKAAEGATENGVVSPQKFANAMEAMNKATGVFFSPKDKARIDGMVRLLKATQRASEAAAMPATGIQNVPSAMGAGLGAAFGWAAFPIAGAYGLLARAYESAPVRNRLLQLGKTKPGSKAEAFVMRDLSGLLAKIAPSAANDVGPALGQTPLNAAANAPADQKQE